MTGEQIQKLLIKCFNKFDEDGSGQLEYPEFKAAFLHLGLNGSEAEIREAFKKVGVDGSGKVDVFLLQIYWTNLIIISEAEK